jgi:hypothetical protein
MCSQSMNFLGVKRSDSAGRVNFLYDIERYHLAFAPNIGITQVQQDSTIQCHFFPAHF